MQHLERTLEPTCHLCRCLSIHRYPSVFCSSHHWTEKHKDLNYTDVQIDDANQLFYDLYADYWAGVRRRYEEFNEIMRKRHD